MFHMSSADTARGGTFYMRVTVAISVSDQTSDVLLEQKMPGMP